MTDPHDRSLDDDAWRSLTQRLEPLEALVPDSVPTWRPATMSLLAVLGVALTALPAALPMMLLGRALDIPAESAAHGLLIGAWTGLWGFLSLGVLALAARLTIGRAATIARRDLLFGAPVLVIQIAWIAALHAWNVGAAGGRVELDLIARATYFWPLVVIVLVVLLAAIRLCNRQTALILAAITALAIGFLLNETISNAFGALRDGDVAPAGLLVGALSGGQLLLLAVWWLDTASPRLRKGS